MSHTEQAENEKKEEEIKIPKKPEFNKSEKIIDKHQQPKSSIHTKQHKFLKTVSKNSKPNNRLSERQEVIIDFFKKGGDEKVRLKDIKKFFPDYTSRTIRNDLKGLCDIGLVLRSNGKGQASFYYLP